MWYRYSVVTGVLLLLAFLLFPPLLAVLLLLGSCYGLHLLCSLCFQHCWCRICCWCPICCWRSCYGWDTEKQWSVYHIFFTFFICLQISAFVLLHLSLQIFALSLPCESCKKLHFVTTKRNDFCCSFASFARNRKLTGHPNGQCWFSWTVEKITNGR